MHPFKSRTVHPRSCYGSTQVDAQLFPEGKTGDLRLTENINAQNGHSRSLNEGSAPSSMIEHLGSHRQYWRDIVLAINDGLVSTFLLVAGVSGGGLDAHSIYLTAVSGGIAGSISMAAGEWIATKSQNDVLTGEIELENLHILGSKDSELDELKNLLLKIGIDSARDPSLYNHLVSHYSKDNNALLQVMKALEFGFIEEERRNPIVAGTVSFFLFLIGSIPSIIPFAFVENPTIGLLIATIFVTMSLFVVGAVKTFATRGKWYNSAIENFVVAAGGGSAAYGIGILFNYLSRPPGQ